ncbi:MAG: site-specific integrase [Gammaproteobacteria bacterium]|nr:site-specific integrase [Gammaproteobacteria bacterium]
MSLDIEAREWRIPAERMKTGREHRVPLSAGALAVLRAARGLSDGSGVAFPAARGGPLSEMAISKMVRDLGIGAVPHGFRSSFRDWAAECTDAPREVCELALAHVNTNRIEAAYRRTDLFERRRALMEQWAAFLAGGCNSASAGASPAGESSPRVVSASRSRMLSARVSTP